ncbi:MAG: hypothetical protein A3J48_00365 [Candidatus Doudnabacteria bacterium RIFCSPHIGHO2_02_FULL_46_11]|uniref:HTH arsR-type domain-containing protein n=1 Tax=Candidatus Doudnabacteria bacterium RIFCSPHIGHO2_02_FULL_46_11 TaxID=1817832 RepID=A0A1F5P5L7_9BACT|nr:MAG: hypothetical protein A3J48_00365 [Candidatus Doudnabacteria bacterium RIFCSPHIGHO2_02_FULL_46_11]
MKSFKQIERRVKGFANHRRVEIMFLLYKKPELSLQGISDELRINFRTASEHVRRLAISGMVVKRHEGNEVRHKLTSIGRNVLKFLRILE